VRRIVGILVLAWFFALGSGAVESAHNAQHARDDATILPSAGARTAWPGDHPAAPVHDDSNCRFHATLHAPLIAAQTAVIAVSIYAAIDRVPPLAPVYVSTRIPTRIDCRGPPAFV
jgi:hypothetical protein